MPRSIADIRKANGGLDNLTDEDILQATYEDYAPYYKSIDDYASAVGYAGAGRGLASSRISSAFDSYEGNMYGLGGAVARKVGATGVGEWMDKQRISNESAANYANQRSHDLGGIEDWRDVHGVGDAANWLGGQAAQSAPYVAETAGWALADVATGGALTPAWAARAGAVAPRALGGAGLRSGADFAARRAAMEEGATFGRAAMAGGAATYPSSVGDILNNQREAGGEDLLSAAAGGVPYAAMNMFGETGVVARGFRPLGELNAGMARRMGVGALRTGTEEAIGETGQEMINQGFGRMAVNPNEQFFSEDAKKRYVDSAIGGFALGGLAGGVAGIRGPRTVDQGSYDFTQTDEQKGDPLQLGYSPLAGTPIVFPDGSVALNSEQELQARYGKGMPAPAADGQQQSTGTLQGTAPAPVQTAASLDAVDQGLTEVGIPLANGKKTRENQRAFYQAAVDSGIPLDSDLLVPFWGMVSANKFGDKTKVALQNAIVAHRKEQANGTSSAPVADAGTSSVGPSTVANGSVGTGGPVAPVGGTGSGTSLVAGAAAPQVSPVVNTGVQQNAPVSTVVNTQQTHADPFQVTANHNPQAMPLVDTSEDSLEIARMTGNSGVADAVHEDTQGLRADAHDTTVDKDQVAQSRFGKSKNAKRDLEIMQAYHTALRDAPNKSKMDVQRAIAEQYGVDPSRVRQIGSPQALVKAGESLGYTRDQVLEAFGIPDNARTESSDVSKLEYELDKLKKQHASAPEKRKQSIANQMARVSEDLAKAKEKEDEARRLAVSDGLRAAGVDTAEGETSGMGALDTDRHWQEESSSGNKEGSMLIKLGEQIAQLREALAKFKAQGQTEVAQEIADRIEREQARLDHLMASLETKPEPTKAKPPEVAEARKRWQEAGRDITKLDTADLEVLEPYVRGLGNPKLADEIKFEINVRGEPVATPAATSVEEPAGAAAPAEPTNAEEKILTPQEQYDSLTNGYPVPAWTELSTKQQSRIADLAHRDQLNLSALNEIVAPKAETKAEETKAEGGALTVANTPAQRTAAAPAALTDESNIIDVEARVIDDTVHGEVLKLTDARVERLEKHYGFGRDTKEFLAKVQEDVVAYVNKGAQAVNAAIRDIIKAIANGVLAMAIVFNPNMTATHFKFDLPTVQQQVKEVRAQVPADAAAKMSDLAKNVYSKMAPVAAKTGKGFIVADKPNGMIHVFDVNGKTLVQEPALFGKDSGDTMIGYPYKITPAGEYKLNVAKWDEYVGGYTVDLMDKDELIVVSLHAAYLAHPEERREARLATPTGADNKISGGCINTTHDTFLNKIMPNFAKIDGGMIFVLPDNQANTESMFKGTTETVNVNGPANATSNTDRTLAAKEENDKLNTTLFSKNRERPKGKNTVADILKTIINKFHGDAQQHYDFVRVYQTAKEAWRAAGKSVPLNQLENAQAFVDPRDPRVVHLIADNIPAGHEFAVLIHDVGVHVGLKGKLGANFKILEAQVQGWKNADKSSLEYQVWERATARVAAARMEGSATHETAAEELVAYAAEEAIEMGVKPVANSKNKLEAWLSKLGEIVTKALENFFGKSVLPDLSAQDLVNFSFAAAQGHMQAVRTEVGAAGDASDIQVVRYYTGVDRGRKVSDGARINENTWDEGTNTAEYPGEEIFHWGNDSTYGSFTNIATAAGVGHIAGTGPNDARTFSMVLVSDESRKVAEETGNKSDKILLNIQAVEDPYTKMWNVVVYGPAIDGELFKRLAAQGKAALTRAFNQQDWTRLEGISPADTRRLMSEFRRRLTRVNKGMVPGADWTRVTGSGSDTDGGRDGGASPEQLATYYSKAKTNVTPKAAQKSVGNMTRILKTWGSKALNTAMFSQDLFDRAAAMGIAAAKDLGRLYQKRAALTGQIEREVIRIEQMFNRIKGDERQIANDFLKEMRFAKKWGFKPEWRTGAVQMDAGLEAAFNDLSPSAQAWVKAVFQHGDKMREMKQEAVRNSFASVYDARIADAKKANDTDKVAALEKEKAAELTRYKRLFAQDERNPYAPVRRFGNWVVVGKSQEYMDAEEAGDKEAMAKLEADSDHYFVDFRENYGEALKLSQDLNDSGLMAGEPREKEAARNDMYGGLMTAFDKLRGNIESELGNATSPAEKKALAAAREVVVDLYLRSLADTSARKSELRFKGVAGDIDMLRSFSSQGRADAHFLAAATFNPQMTEAITKMRQQKKTAGNETQKTMAFNEIMARHEQSMKYTDGGWYEAAGRATAVTSAWMLATSPMYYLQNLTQPAVISVPFMSGKHDYTAVWGQLLRAYHQMGALLKSAKVGEGFDFTQVPEDVRAAIQELVNRGRIDIGMDTELGKVKLEGDSLAAKAGNRTSLFFRTIAQKSEAINRVSTAMAAYRLELKRTGDAKAALEYADEVLNKTHGDYTASNAPRLFNTPAGKVALQFRKFQLIQLTLLTKLTHDAFKGASKAERGAARKMLAFTLAHTGTLAGVVGMPGFAAASFIINKLADLFGDDDEPYNVENELRKALGNGDFARVVMRGLPMAAGMDLSGKVGMGNALSILPYSDMDMTRAGFNEMANGLTLGATGGLGARVWTALGDIKDGDYYRGLAGLMPKGVADAFRAFHEASNGLSSKQGDTLVGKDEMGTFDTFAKAIGLTTAKESERKFDQQVVYDTKEAFKNREQQLKKQYIGARRDGDAEAAQDAIKGWQKLQTSRREAGFTVQPMSTLMKAPLEQMKRERMVAGGVQFNKQNRNFVRTQTAD